MQTIQYSDILKQSLVMTWKNKFMWFFGLFIFLGSIITNINGSSLSGKNEQTEVVKIFIQDHPIASISLVLVIAILLITLFLLKIVAIAGVIKSANNIAVYSQSKIKAIFCEAKKYLWTLFLFEIMLCIVIFAIILLLIIPIAYLFFLKAYIFAVSLLTIAFLIAISIIIIAYFIKRYAYCFIILGNMKIGMAVEKAYYLLLKNIRESLAMGLVTIAVSILICIAILVLLVAAAIALFPIGLLAHLIFAKIGVGVVLTAGVIVEVVLCVSLLSLYASFSQIMWVLFFQEISLEKKEKKIALEKIEAEAEVPTPEVI